MDRFSWPAEVRGSHVTCVTDENQAKVTYVTFRRKYLRTIELFSVFLPAMVLTQAPCLHRDTTRRHFIEGCCPRESPWVTVDFMSARNKVWCLLVCFNPKRLWGFFFFFFTTQPSQNRIVQHIWILVLKPSSGTGYSISHQPDYNRNFSSSGKLGLA